MQLDILSSDGDGTILYPSGRTAVTVCKSASGFFHTFIADSDVFQVLCCFDTDGVGSVNYAQGGNPWLVTTKAGWMLCSKEGRIEQRGSWPRTAKEPIICQLTPELTVTFVDQQHIQAAFSCADVDRLFQVGEYLRRSEGIAALGTDAQGRLQLDIPAIRQRISTVGSLYTPPGPHHSVTPQPGLGNLRSIVSKMDPASELRATISALDKGQARIAGLTTLKHTYGSRSSSRSSSRPGSSAPATAAAAAAAAGDADTADAEQDAPYGSPVLTPAQQKLAAKLKRAEVAKPNYTIRRKKLPLLSVAQLDALLGPAGPQDVLIAVCVLASWNPVCTKLEHYQLQAAAYELQQQAAAAKHVHGGGGGALQHGSSRDGSGSSCSSSVALGADAAYIQMYKVDGSESRELQQRYGFRSIPMFLLFYGGRLVSAGNSMRSADELLAAAAAGLAAGRRRDFLPEGFRFGAGGDNAMLDSITKDMSLLG